ncbi:hypothetical protein A0J61_06895 [Choanephora cucurbitarum]|uniref:Uncharacterized protein n=1 Tax=Choanephora cucurbitarum TaxID=101091 RepID=A0A1C7N7F6_9FUNG|nr:hypothetical protein A0J61_06895 [Choanephora cucurbitarum]
MVYSKSLLSIAFAALLAQAQAQSSIQAASVSMADASSSMISEAFQMMKDINLAHFKQEESLQDQIDEQMEVAFNPVSFKASRSAFKPLAVKITEEDDEEGSDKESKSETAEEDEEEEGSSEESNEENTEEAADENAKEVSEETTEAESELENLDQNKFNAAAVASSSMASAVSSAVASGSTESPRLLISLSATAGHSSVASSLAKPSSPVKNVNANSKSNGQVMRASMGATAGAIILTAAAAFF